MLFDVFVGKVFQILRHLITKQLKRVTLFGQKNGNGSEKLQEMYDRYRDTEFFPPGIFPSRYF